MKFSYFSEAFFAILMFFNWTSSKLQAQTEDTICSFNLSPEEEINLIRQIERSKLYAQNRNGRFNSVTIPVRFTVYRFDDGSVSPPNSAPITQAIIDEAIVNLNNIYSPMDVSFIQCGAISYIDNTKVGLLNVSSSYFGYVSNALNVNIGITNLTGGLLGSANRILPPSLISFDNNHTNNTWVKYARALTSTNTLAHEIGHNLQLLHTFHGAALYDNPQDPIENSPGLFYDQPTGSLGVQRELVIRAEGSSTLNYPFPNSTEGGDFIQDTPAWGKGGSEWPDPTDPDCFVYNTDFGGVVQCAWGIIYDPITCEYLGNYLDYNGHPLENTDISIRNIMSYTGRCRTEFTPEQFDVMTHANDFIGTEFWNESLCSNFEDFVEYEGTTEPIKNVTIAVSHPLGNGKHCRVTSASDGAFSGVLFENLLKTKIAWIGSGDKNPDYSQSNDNSYAIYDYTYNDWIKGVTTADVITIRRHLLGQVLLNGYRQLAADVTQDGRVTTLDIIRIKKLILHQINAFESVSTGPWRFIPEYIPAKYDTNFHINPFNLTLNEITYEEEAPYLNSDWEYIIDDGVGGVAGFDGIKMGDVNGDNLDGVIEGCPNYEIIEIAPPISKDEEKVVVLHLKPIDFNDVVGFQLGFYFDNDALELLEINSSLPNFSNANFSSLGNEKEGKPELRVLWVDQDLSPKVISERGVLLEVIVKTKVVVDDISDFFHLDNDVLKAEFYDKEGCPKPVQIIKEEAGNTAFFDDNNNGLSQSSFLKSKSLADPISSLLCYPSPHSGKWTIAFRSVEESRGEILIQTIRGTILLNQKVSLNDGVNTWDIDRSDWPEGVLLVSIQCGQGRFTQRVIHLK